MLSSWNKVNIIVCFLFLFEGILEWLDTLKAGNASFMGFLTRETMEKAETYKQAQTMLANTPMRVPAYFILGGVRQGEVVSTLKLSFK